MADDIVQTIKVEVEGAEEAAAALGSIGEGATTSFEDTQKAADTAGVSIDDFGKLSEKTQQAYLELSRRVVQGSEDIVQSTHEVQQAAEQSGGGARNFGGGLDEVSKKSGITTREMRGLSKIMKEFGAGELAGQAFGLYKIATSLGAIGLAAIAVAKITQEVIKFIKEAVDAAKAIDEVAKAGGGGIESLQRLERAFASAGGTAKEFSKSWLDVMSNMEKEDAARNATPDMLKLANSVSYVAYQLQRMALGSKEVISPLTSVKTLSEAIGKVLNDMSKGVVSPFIRTVPPDAANKLNDYMNKLAKLREQFIATGGKAAEFDKALKQLGLADAAIKQIAMGSQAMKEFMDQADRKPSLSHDTVQLLVANIQTIGESIGRIANQFTEGVFSLMRRIPSLVGLLPESVLGPLETLGQTIRAAFVKMKDSVGELLSQAPSGSPWEWMKTTFFSVVDAMQAKMDEGAAMIKEFVTTAIPGAFEWMKNMFASVIEWMRDKLFGGAAPATSGSTSGGGSAWAGGGLLGGRGSGTSDSNLAWVSRGEYIVPARIVQQPGVLAFLEALRRSGRLLGFAGGGPVLGRPLQHSDTGDSILDSMIDTLAKIFDAIEKAAKITVEYAGNLDKTLRDMADGVLAHSEAVLAALRPAAEDLQRLARDPGGNASGGLLGGRGTGTSDSNLAWVSRGEHIQPAHVVRQPGVLAFLEALRLSGGNLRRVLDGMGHFALGGMVRAPLAIPAFAGGGMNHVSIHFPGLPEITGLRASSAVVDELRQAAALAQVRSGGRKPSRYR